MEILTNGVLLGQPLARVAPLPSLVSEVQGGRI